jgi:transposase
MNPSYRRGWIKEIWTKRIAAYQENVQMMKAWCAEQNLTVHQLKYWLYKAQKRHNPGAIIRAVTVTVNPENDPLWIQVCSARITVRPGFEPRLLREVVAALETPMLNLAALSQVYLACGATDMRKSIDGLAAIVQEQFALNPFSTALFVFCKRKRDKLKILQWDHAGFWLYYRNLERGTFHWASSGRSPLCLTERELRWLLDGLSLSQRQAHPTVSPEAAI